MLHLLELGILLTILTHTVLFTYIVYRHFNPVQHVPEPTLETKDPEPSPMNEVINSLNEFMTDSKSSNKGDE